MLGNFTYHNATKVHFGKDALGLLGDELKNYGPKVMLSYGGGSIKHFGIYDQVVKVLREAGKTIIEDGGVLPNPDIEKVLEGARKVREEGVDLILAVGGGSTADYAKAVSASAYQERDPWDYYFKHFGKLDSRALVKAATACPSMWTSQSVALPHSVRPLRPHVAVHMILLRAS